MLSAVGAVVVSALLLGLLGFGYGTIPALGPALDPGRGRVDVGRRRRAGHLADAARPRADQAGHGLVHQGRAGLDQRRRRATTCSWPSATCRPSTGCRRWTSSAVSGEGQLAQLGGPSDLASDEFELRLGLLRTAQNEWAQTTGDGQAGAARLRPGRERRHRAGPGRRRLARGVHADRRLPQALDPGRQPGHPGACSPRSWTTRPARSTTRSCSARSARPTPATGSRTVPANTWTPFDPGPYRKEPLTPVAADLASSAPAGQSPTASTTAIAGPGQPEAAAFKTTDEGGHRGGRASSSTSSASCPPTRSTSTRTATPGR